MHWQNNLRSSFREYANFALARNRYGVSIAAKDTDLKVKQQSI